MLNNIWSFLESVVIFAFCLVVLLILFVAGVFYAIFGLSLSVVADIVIHATECVLDMMNGNLDD